MKNLIGENIRYLRKQKKLTQEELALMTGVSRQSLTKWESGETLPDIENCRKLVSIFDISLDLLVNFSFENEKDEADSMEGKYIFGMTRVEAGGRVTLPDSAKQVFSISDGDCLIVMGDTTKGGLALAKIMG